MLRRTSARDRGKFLEQEEVFPATLAGNALSDALGLPVPPGVNGCLALGYVHAEEIGRGLSVALFAHNTF